MFFCSLNATRPLSCPETYTYLDGVLGITFKLLLELSSRGVAMEANWFIWDLLLGGAILILGIFVVPVLILVFLKNKTPFQSKKLGDDTKGGSQALPTDTTLTSINGPGTITDHESDAGRRAVISKPSSGIGVFVVRMFIVSSILLYSISLIMPFNVIGEDQIGGGAIALIIGIIYLPFWLPNPLFFIAIALAARWRMLASSIFAFAAVFISGGLIVSNPHFHPDHYLTHTGPIAFVWCSSFVLLLIASVIGLAINRGDDMRRT